MVRCNLAGRWEMAMADTDKVKPAWLEKDTGEAPKVFGKGDQLTLVYNGYVRELSLYVNGSFSQAIELASPFTATGGVQLGRALHRRRVQGAPLRRDRRRPGVRRRRRS